MVLNNQCPERPAPRTTQPAKDFWPRKDRDVYNRSWNGVSISEFIDVLDKYLVWYNEKRIKLSLGAMSPVEYRKNLGLAV